VIDALLERFTFHHDVVVAARAAASRVAPFSYPANGHVRAAVMSAFHEEGVVESDLWGAFGYGYDDVARRRYESLLARVLGAERALARLSLVSGTHAIHAALAACVEPGERLIVATGPPYDTLRNALVDAEHSLVSRGIAYAEVALARGGGPDFDAIRAACSPPCRAAFVQRSRGYADRRSLSAAECGAIARAVKEVAPAAIVLVDNCYGELVETTEPTAHGADLVMGSLIKNLGGGLAPGGGYIAGRADLVERVAAHHYAPGLGSAVGPTLGFGRLLVQGLFMAPLAIGECLAGLDFVAALFEEFGYRVSPRPGETRVDIVQAIGLGDAARLVLFARGLQGAMPLNARFAPEPGPVPGYRDPVIMSGGAFVGGSTIELSCDAPLRPPYEVYVQGGTMREHTAFGALRAADALARAGALRPGGRADFKVRHADRPK
jgi:cystathionine beta-lyase family protein involved in aluminum resistance